MKSILSITLFLLLWGMGVTGQTVRGIVVDESANPLAYVNIVLVSGCDSTFCGGCISGEDGGFVLNEPHLSGCQYVLHLSSIGYKSVCVMVPQNGEVGTVRMESEAALLDEVVIKAQRPLTQLKGGALVTTVENSLLSKTGTAMDLMGNIPGVLENNGTLEVFGKGRPLVYIDGRKVRDMSELDRLSSEEIKSVEVINNPGARYDATVNAVIRIRTLSGGKTGFSLNLRSLNGMGHYYYGGHQVNAEYRMKRFSLFGTLYAYEYKYLQGISIEQETHVEDVWKMDWQRDKVMRQEDYSGKLGFVYQPNERHSWGGYYQNGSYKTWATVDYNSDVYLNGQFYDNTRSEQDENGRKFPSHLANLYYAGQWGRLDVDLNADYVYRKTNSGQEQDEISENYHNQTVTTSNKNRSRLFAQKLVLGYPMGRGRLELGEEYTNSNFRSEFLNLEKILTDETSEVKEDNLAAFVEWQQPLGKADIRAGVRYEHVSFEYLVNGDPQAMQCKTYNDWFPSLSVSMPVGRVSLGLSFNSKTVRPNYGQLDGNVVYNNRYSYQGGNPYLKPTRTNNLDLTATWKWLNLNVGYENGRDVIQTTNKPYGGDNKIVFITYDNYDRQQKLKLFLGASPAVGIWKPQFSIGVQKQWFEADYLGQSRSFGTPQFYVGLNNTWQLPADFILRLNGAYDSGGAYGCCEMFSSWWVDVSLYKELFGGRFSVMLKGTDLFNKRLPGAKFYNSNVFIRQTNRVETRYFSITLRYKLNNFKKNNYKGKGAGSGEKERLGI